MTVLLEVKSLQKVYTTRFGGNSVTALSNVNFSVEKRGIHRYHGRVRLREDDAPQHPGGYRQADEGQVLLIGEDITSISEKEISAFRRNNLGFVFQDFNLLDTFNLKTTFSCRWCCQGKSTRR